MTNKEVALYARNLKKNKTCFEFISKEISFICEGKSSFFEEVYVLITSSFNFWATKEGHEFWMNIAKRTFKN
jgi:hypothetical protein